MRYFYFGIMKLYITKCVNLFLISLNIMTYNADAYNRSDLAIICAPCWGTQIIWTAPPLCTALSLTSFNKDYERIEEASVFTIIFFFPVNTFSYGNTCSKDLTSDILKPDLPLNAVLGHVKSIKGTLPLMAVDNRYYLTKWAKLVTSPASDYIQEFLEIGVDIIAMDIMNYRKNPYPFKDEHFTENLIKFINAIKHDHPEMLIGIAMRMHRDPTLSSVDVKAINSHVDFYLLKYIPYRDCKHAEKKEDMVYAVSPEDIMSTVTLFRDCGMDSSKLIYTIDLRIETYKHVPMISKDYEDMSFSQLCSTEVSKYRKFCYNTIPDLFNKAQLRIKENLLGIYIANTDYDDHNGSCLCAGPDGQPIKFKGISVITGASSDDKAKVESFLCSTDYPIIKNP